MKQVQTNPSYNDIDRGCSNIVQQVLNSQSLPSVVVGLTRGGLIPAVIISHMLGQIASVHMVPVSYSAKTGKGEFKGYANTLMPLPAVNVLIVDDICDSGHTMKEVASFYTNSGYVVRTASLYYKESSLYQPTYFWRQIPTDSCWIQFPWEQG